MALVLERRGRVGLYLALWVLIGLLLAALLTGQAGLDWRSALLVSLPLAAVYSSVCMSAWFLARSTPLSSSGPVRLIATALGASVISSGAWLVVARVWNYTLSRWAGVHASYGEISDVIFGFGVLIYLLSLAVAYIAVAAVHAQAAERRALEGQVLSREAELRSLRAQIDPHFLFNSLHSISALTAANPEGARRMCLLLAEFFRESLQLGAQEQIPLARELLLAEKYLEIEQVRYGDRLKVEVNGTGAGECLVPSLLLQPIVENAVTHGIAHMLDGGTVRVTADRTPSRLHVRVESPCDPDRPRRKGAGVGLANVRSRLHALHGADASVDAIEENERWQVDIRMPALEPSRPGL
jgi:two-component system sensor histidine kinase AlgZ